MGLGCCCGTVSECNRGVNRHHGTEGERGSRFGRVKHGPPGRPCCAKASRLVHSCNSPSQDLSLEEYLVEHHASLSEAFVGNQSTCTYYPTAGVAPSPTKATLAPPSLTEKAVSSPCSPVVVAAQPTRPRSPSGLHGMSSKVHAFLFPFSRITDARLSPIIQAGVASSHSARTGLFPFAADFDADAAGCSLGSSYPLFVLSFRVYLTPSLLGVQVGCKPDSTRRGIFPDNMPLFSLFSSCIITLFLLARSGRRTAL